MEPGEEPLPAEPKSPIPKWHETFDQSDYAHFLEVAQERIDPIKLQTTLGNIQDRLSDAEAVGFLPPEERPTNIARGEFIEVPGAKFMIGRVGALSSMTERHGKKRGNSHVLKHRVVNFKVVDHDNIGQVDDDTEVFSADTRMPNGTIIRVRMLKDHRFSVSVDFKRERYEEPIPSYKSGYLTTDRLTREEVDVLARSALEIGFYNIYGDPNQSPYPWEVKLEKPEEKPTDTAAALNEFEEERQRLLAQLEGENRPDID